MKSCNLLLIAAVVLGGPAFAASTTTLAAQAKVSEADARRTALAQVPQGTVTSSELEQEHGKLIWSFDITTPGSVNVSEVNVDARSGKVVDQQTETPASEKDEQAAEKAEQAPKK
jgi:uncharacterized membrane protein YkoI